MHEPSVAEQTLREVKERGRLTENEFLVGLAEVVLAYRRDDGSAIQRADAFVAAIRRLFERWPTAKDNRLLRHLVRRVFRDLAKEEGSAIRGLRRLELEWVTLGWEW